MSHSGRPTKEEKEMLLKIIQRNTGRRQPRRYLQKMFDMYCLYFLVFENRNKEWFKKEIDEFFER